MIEYEGLFKDDVVIDVNDDMRMKWIDKNTLVLFGCVESLIIADRFNPDISSLILNNSLISLKQIEVGNDCFANVNRFVIDGLNELDRIIIGQNSMKLEKVKNKGSSCLIMNCDQLRQIYIGCNSLYWYESFELKNLPSLISIQFNKYTFMNCHTIEFYNLTRLQSIILGYDALAGDLCTAQSNSWIMKNLPSLSLIRGYGENLKYIAKVKLENISSLSQDGIMMDTTFSEVKELVCSNADSLEYYITVNSHVYPSDHLLSLHPSVFWILRSAQMEQISSSVESIVIQSDVGNSTPSFNLSNLPSLITVVIGNDAFKQCRSIVFENLTQLQSIIIGSHTFQGINYQPIVYSVKKENELIMRNLPALTLFKGKGNFLNIGKVTIENIPSLTSQGIIMEEYVSGTNRFTAFSDVKELVCSNSALDRCIQQNSRYLQR
ncbi:hypothetical protein WA171_002662 [Blastocystis sp. BT1]